MYCWKPRKCNISFKYALSGTIQHIGSSRKSGHYVTYIFSDSGSTVTLINDTKIQSFDFSTFSTSEGFNNFQRNSHILFYIRTDHINTSTFALSHFTDLILEKHQMLEKYLFSDEKAENGLSFEEVSSCIRPTFWVNDKIISYLFCLFLRVQYQYCVFANIFLQ